MKRTIWGLGRASQRLVASARKRFGDGHFPPRQAIKAGADRHGVRAGTNRKAPGHDSGPARSALRFDIEIRGLRGIVWVKKPDFEPATCLPMAPGKGPTATETPRQWHHA